MRSGEIGKVLVVTHLPKQRIRIPRRRRRNQLTISCPKRKQNSIIERLVVWHEIRFFNPDNLESWTPDCIRIVWESFNHAAIWQSNHRLLNLQAWLLRKLSTETTHAPNVNFGLPPAWTNNRYIAIGMLPSILKKQRRNRKTLARLTSPTHNRKLVLLKQFSEL
jgi:hypothetical protein